MLPAGECEPHEIRGHGRSQRGESRPAAWSECHLNDREREKREAEPGARQAQDQRDGGQRNAPRELRSALEQVNGQQPKRHRRSGAAGAAHDDVLRAEAEAEEYERSGDRHGIAGAAPDHTEEQQRGDDVCQRHHHLLGHASAQRERPYEHAVHRGRHRGPVAVQRCEVRARRQVLAKDEHPLVRVEEQVACGHDDNDEEDEAGEDHGPTGVRDAHLGDAPLDDDNRLERRGQRRFRRRTGLRAHQPVRASGRG